VAGVGTRSRSSRALRPLFLETCRPAETARDRYPAAYSLVVLPVAVIRFAGFALEARGRSIPALATFISITLFALSGAMNVLLLVSTRPNLLLFGRPLGAPDEDPSFGNLGTLATQVTIMQECVVAGHPSELSLPMGASKVVRAQGGLESTAESGSEYSESTFASISSIMEGMP
jgi:hypothetical protein